MHSPKKWRQSHWLPSWRSYTSPELKAACPLKVLTSLQPPVSPGNSHRSFGGHAI
jgi:hypothetical protein